MLGRNSQGILYLAKCPNYFVNDVVLKYGIQHWHIKFSHAPKKSGDFLKTVGDRDVILPPRKSNIEVT